MIRYVLLALLILRPPLAYTQDAVRKEAATLSIELVAKRTTYPWEAKNDRALGRHWDNPAPVVLFALVTNSGKEALDVVGRPSPLLLLTGPDGKLVIPKVAPTFYVERMEVRRIEAGATLRLPLFELQYQDEIRDNALNWTGPGTHTLSLEYALGVSPQPKGTELFPHTAAGLGAVRFGMVRLVSEAVELKVEVGDPVVYWGKTLDEADPDVRGVALGVLSHGSINAKAALPNLLKLAEDADPRMRREALEVIGKMRESAVDAAPRLLARLEDKDFTVRLTAARTLAAIGPKEANVRLGLLPLLSDPLSGVRYAAAREMPILVWRHPDIEPDLEAAFIQGAKADAKPDIRTLLVYALAQLPPERALAGVLPHVRDPERSVALAAIDTVGDIAKRYPRDTDRALMRRAVKELTPLLKEHDKRMNAAGSLWHMTPESEESAGALLSTLEDPQVDLPGNSHLRWFLVQALGAVGAKTEGVGPALVRRLREDEHWNVRRGATDALSQLGPTAREHVPALSAALSDPSEEVRSSVVEALARLGPVASAAAYGLRRLLADPGGVNRERIEAALKAVSEP